MLNISKTWWARLTLSFAATLCVSFSGYASSLKTVYVGGVDGIENLKEPKKSELLRASGTVGLYIHNYAWKKLNDADKQKITQVFRGNGRPSFEGNESGHPNSYWSDVFNSMIYRSIEIAHINTKTPTTFALKSIEWKNLVDVGRQYGVNIVSPIFTPNDGSWKNWQFSDPHWDELRSRAEYGGGITIDSPPWYFNAHPALYKEFISDEIKWAKSRKLISTLIISPPRSNDKGFLIQTKNMLKELKSLGAIPAVFVVENYMSSPPEHYIHEIGDEKDPETVFGVAAWLASN